MNIEKAMSSLHSRGFLFVMLAFAAYEQAYKGYNGR